jgi:energy-coupling factor transporter ATP-binding protein EcfA2
MIEVNNLSYTYAAAQQPAVKGLSFAISRARSLASSDPAVRASRPRRRC